MKIINGTKLYDLEEVGSMFGVGKRTITNYCNRQGIEPQIFLRKKYLTESQITKLVTPRS